MRDIVVMHKDSCVFKGAAPTRGNSNVIEGEACYQGARRRARGLDNVDKLDIH